ncbi:hypothetical protein TNCV_2887721 [Trichonephila clavipes]|nr:hypothetical protein TNCV_2887721 [Trichonephila clavipes]
MGAGSLFPMTASLGVGTHARAQTINNGPMATCTGHLTAGEAIKFSENRWVWLPRYHGRLLVRDRCLFTSVESSGATEDPPCRGLMNVKSVEAHIGRM